MTHSGLEIPATTTMQTTWLVATLVTIATVATVAAESLSNSCSIQPATAMSTPEPPVSLETENAALSMATPKTIYLIRHAQSEENRRLASLQSVGRSLARFAWPRSKDVSASFELLSVSQQVDSPVSDLGREQIAHMAEILRENDFVASRNIQLVAHSPLIRARETCRGMLGCFVHAKDTPVDGVSATVPDDAPELTSSPHLQNNVHELDILKEKTPMEWIPGNAGGMYQRIGALEDWLASRPEQTLCLVGHSQFFKAMLSMDSKFGNCDVVQVQFTPTNGASHSSHHPSWWSHITPVHLCPMQSVTLTADD